MIEYKSLTRLSFGQYFMFSSGTTINIVTHKERNLLIYRNMLTGKIRRVKGFVDINKVDNTCQVRYVKMLDGMLEKLVQDRVDLLNCPFLIWICLVS